MDPKIVNSPTIGESPYASVLKSKHLKIIYTGSITRPTIKSAAASEVRNKLEIVLSDLFLKISHSTTPFPTMVARPAIPNHVDKTIFAVMLNSALSQQVLFIFAMISVLFSSRDVNLQKTSKGPTIMLSDIFLFVCLAEIGQNENNIRILVVFTRFEFSLLLSLGLNTFMFPNSHDTTQPVKCG